MASTREKPLAVSTPMPGERLVTVRSIEMSGTMKCVDMESTKAQTAPPATDGGRRSGGAMALRACRAAKPKDRSAPSNTCA